MSQPQTVHVANQPRKTMHGPGFMALMGHWFMLFATCGLWYPIYRRAKRTNRHY